MPALRTRDSVAFPWSPLPGRLGGFMPFEGATWARRIPGWYGWQQNFFRTPYLFTKILAQRARYLTVNDPLCANGKSELVSHWVGSGMSAEPTIEDQEARSAIVTAWRRWCDVCDADGRLDFNGMQSAITGEIAVTGEGLLHLVPGPDGGLRLRLIPSDRLDSALTQELEGGGAIVGGVELNAQGTRVAYHIRKDDLSFEIVRVPAEDMIHVYRYDFAQQIRGISWFAPCLLTADGLSKLLDSLQMSAQVAACFAGFITDMNSSGPNPFTDGRGAQRDSVFEGGLEPATLKVLPNGWDIKFSQPQQVTTAMELAKLQINLIAAALGIPNHLISTNVSEANYSSLRAANMAFGRRLLAYRFQLLAPQFLQPVYRRWLTTEVLSGRLDLPGFSDDPESFLAVNWNADPLDYVDPLKDVQAEILAIQAGLKSRRQAISERGGNIEEIDQQIAADRAREQALNLSFSTAVSPPQPPGDGS